MKNFMIIAHDDGGGETIIKHDTDDLDEAIKLYQQELKTQENLTALPDNRWRIFLVSNLKQELWQR